METTSSAAPAAESGRSGPLTATLGLVVVGVGLWFAFESGWGMDNWYSIFKWVHVTLAVFWVGGGLLLTVLGLRAERSTDPREIVTLARQAAFTGEKIFAPAGLIVLLMGIGMTVHNHLGFGHFWITAGLVGYALTFATGVGVLSPLAKKIDASAVANGAEHPITIALIRRILLVARVDVAVLLLVVADMVLKPFA
jgi:uncharacterized membrane protein